jgi:alpha-D-ribose 1-methylphosphonate 5-triphosphate diphosphatase
MTNDTILTNARIVLSDDTINGTLHLRDGLIADISSGSTVAGLDMGGDYLMPGLVELHTDHLESHFLPRPSVRWDPVMAALAHDGQMAASGVTTVLDAIRIGAAPDDRTAAGAARILAEALEQNVTAGWMRADHFLHLRCEVPAANCMDEFEWFAGNPFVQLVSLMDHTPGQRQYASLEVFKSYHMKKSHVSEAAFDAFSRDLVESAAKYSEVNRYSVAALALEHGTTLASHDDATAAQVEESRLLGVTIAEFPTTVESAQASREKGFRIVMGAPNIVRRASQSGNIAAIDLLELGLLDILSSDYVPFSPLQAVFLLAHERTRTLPEATRMVSLNPARAVNLHDRGELVAGKRADVVRVENHGPIPIVREVWREGHRVS